VKSGELARVLVRPYSYVAYQFATSCGETAVRLPLQALLGGLVVWLAVGPPPAGPLAFVGAAVALALSLTLSFLIAAGIGLLAFWCEETLPFYWIYQKLVFTLGGLFLPLELLPSPLADVAGKLPFASIAYAPGRIFVGSSPEVALTQLGSQLVWVGIALAAVTLIYRRGVRKLNVHGG
jgi:ABC-2 type transport system permease protein